MTNMTNVVRFQVPSEVDFMFKTLFMKVHVQAVLSILLSMFAGFGVAMSGSAFLIEFLRWRRRWNTRLNQHNGSQMTARSPETANSQANSVGHAQSDMINVATFSRN